MSEIVMLTNADMTAESGDVTLILRRAHAFARELGMPTTCMILNEQDAIPADRPGIRFVKINYFGAADEYIREHQPAKVIFYGLRMYPYVVSRLKKWGPQTAILLDIQGTLEELVEHPQPGAGLKNQIKYRYHRRHLQNAMRVADGALVVSDQLGQYCLDDLDPKRIQPFQIHKVRCGIDELITVPQRLAWREKVREAWGISPQTVVPVFSGYRLPWQKVDEIIAIFQKLDQQHLDIFFAFFCNMDPAFSQQLANAFPRGNYVVSYLSREAYFPHLCACDVGMLLRDYTTTNWVAFPNKFSDYLNAGLMVAMNQAVPEPYGLLADYKIPFVDLEIGANRLYTAAMARQHDLAGYYGIVDPMSQNELLYATQVQKLGWKP